ncbi:MAG TPA: hypothetical protein VEB22_13070 [Phycisphaerales bacterium]|nr:hypothetical protein [Phycisphaerales bacterium]
MKYVLASVLTLGGAALCVMLLSLLLAGSPNSSPAQLARIKGWMLATVLVGLLGATGAVWAMAIGRPGLGAYAGAAPAAFCIAAFVYLYTAASP